MLLRDSFYAWIDDNVQRLGAALAYYTVFSLAPLLIIAIAIAGLAFGQEAAQGQIMSQIEGLLGEQGAKATQAMIENARQPSAGLVASLLGIILLVFGIRAFSAVQQAKARLANEGAYRKIAEKAVAAQSETATALSSIQATLADVKTRLTAVEKILKEVE